jgi:hypothetical protein
METHGQGAASVLCLGIAPPPESDGMAAPPPPPPPAQGLWHRVVSECLRREPVQHGQQLCQAGAGVRELLLALGEKALGETAVSDWVAARSHRLPRHGGPVHARNTAPHSMMQRQHTAMASFASQRPKHLQSKRLLIESWWVSTPLDFAGKLRPRRLNGWPF